MSLGSVLGAFGLRYFDFLAAPVRNPDMLWILGPLMVYLFYIRLYLSYYKYESFGWNSAISSSLGLIFICTNLFGFMARNEVASKTLLVIIVGVVMFFALVMVILLSAHKMPRKAAYEIASKYMYLLSYVMVVLVYSNLPADLYTLFAAAGAFVFLLIIINTLESLIHGKYTAMQSKEFVEEPILDHRQQTEE